MADKIENFTDTIIDDATAESDQILELVRKEWDSSVSSLENEILNEAFNHIKKEVTKIRSEAGRRISQKVLENKRTLFAKRQKVSDDVKARVLSRIAEFTAPDDYLGHLITQLESCVAEFGDDIVVYLRPADMRYADSLKKAVSQRLTFKEYPFRLGGLMADSLSKNRRVDLSFDTAMLEYDRLFNRITDLKSE